MDDGGAIGKWAAAETTAACGGACEGVCVRRRAANANDVGERLRGDSCGALWQWRRRRMRQRRRRRRAACGGGGGDDDGVRRRQRRRREAAACGGVGVRRRRRSK
jgi:hypothetical protein